MKPLTWILLLALTLSIPVNAQQEDLSIRHITVNGTATLDVVPDLMRWQISVRSEAKTAKEVASKHDVNVAAAIAFLKKEEIAKNKIQTSQLRLNELYDFRGGQRTRKGFFATTNIQFESGTLEAYRELWIGLSQLETVSVNNVLFDTSKRDQHQFTARLRALDAAKNKAKNMVTHYQSHLGKVLVIEDQSIQTDVRQAAPVRALRSAAVESAPVGDSISLGTIPIRVTVRVVFAIDN